MAWLNTSNNGSASIDCREKRCGLARVALGQSCHGVGPFRQEGLLEKKAKRVPGREEIVKDWIQIPLRDFSYWVTTHCFKIQI